MSNVHSVNEEIHTEIGKIVIISLNSNPSTGYGWIAEFDPKFIRLVRKEFTPSSNLIGAGGIERFEFEALASGVTTLRMVYKREWEMTFLDEKVYQIHVA